MPLDVRALEAEAVAYLRSALGERAPRYLTFELEVAEFPLEGEGAAAVFSFDLPQAGAAACAGEPARHYVVVGETEPNYFPAYGLSADDAYSFHIGTRFLLQMRIGRVDDEQEPPQARAAMRQFVHGTNPDARVQEEELAGVFRCEDQRYVVYRLRVEDTPVYVMGGDLPPGFYRLTQHPPQTALRLHLGKLIRAEPPDRPV